MRERKPANTVFAGKKEKEKALQSAVSWVQVFCCLRGTPEEKKILLAKKDHSRYVPIPAAGVAQLAEQLICNQQVAGSIPIASSIFWSDEEKELHISRIA